MGNPLNMDWFWDFGNEWSLCWLRGISPSDLALDDIPQFWGYAGGRGGALDLRTAVPDHPHLLQSQVPFFLRAFC